MRSQALKKSTLVPDPEYAVYTFRKLKADKGDQSDWERAHTTTDRVQALKQAADLYKTEQYTRVEIKKQFFDARKDCKVDQTLKTYDENPYRALRGLGITLLAFLCGFLAADAAVWLSKSFF